MRLHELEITAFGPFATTVRVDFDDLSEAGLFLLSGATGAGKTSVLDAVCFALYGDVPGERSGARRLRSDQAAPGLAPEVRLDVTLSGRRFRVVRSPTWERPKRRGDGLTTEHAHVTVSERLPEGWTPLTSRLDEAGDLIGSLLGMTLTQFTQVALLPQGRFQAFLRARSEERHRLLQRLFRTGRFEQVERILHERRSALRALDEEHRGRLAALVSRISEAAGADLPPEIAEAVEDPGPGDPETVSALATTLLTEAETDRHRCAAEADRAAAEESRARLRREESERRAEQHRRLAEARAEHDELLTRRVSHDDDRLRLDRARQAAPIAPLQRTALATETALREAQERVERTDRRLRHCWGAAPPPETADLPEAARAAAEAAAAARAARPRQEQAEEAGRRLARTTRHLAATEREQRELAEEHEALPARVSALRAELVGHATAAARIDDVTAALASATARGEAHAQLTDLLPRREEARREWLDARAEALDAQERLILVQQQRIEGMAAELAGRLAVGACCPVCGSDHHPAKARHAGVADRAVETERLARVELDDARVVEHARDQAVRDLETRIAVTRDRSGTGDAATAHDDRTRLEVEARSLRCAAAAEKAGRAALVAAEQTLAGAEARLAELIAQAATAEAQATALGGELARWEDELAGLAGDHGDLEAAIAHHEARERAAREAVDARTDAEAARDAWDGAARELDAAAREAGFGSPAEAAAAALEARAVDRLAEAVAVHERRRAAVSALMAELDAAAPDLAAADTDRPGSSEQDLSPADAASRARVDHQRALGELTSAQAAERVTVARVGRLTGLATQLGAALDRRAPVRAELELTTRLSAFVEGRSADNALRMRLSAYVLAYRLSQVVAAANERLARMSDQRFTLEHTGQRGVGETRGGLSLLVRDDWSGECRDPATLSGGETFVVSLALALGLADVIGQETGGPSLDTLFVDEGFGSLDADTLDDVMDTLDSLRDGGRVVGVVSHVSELRDRIPTQLVVTKSRDGSSVSVRR